LASVRSGVLCNRYRIAVASRLQAGGIDAVISDQEILHRLSPATREIEIVIHAADDVRMPFNIQLYLGFSLQVQADVLEHSLRLRSERIFVEIKENRVSGGFSFRFEITYYMLAFGSGSAA